MLVSNDIDEHNVPMIKHFSSLYFYNLRSFKNKHRLKVVMYAI